MYVAESATLVTAIPSAPRRADRKAVALALLLGIAGFGVVLAGVRSTIFDLDRHAVPKELVLHIIALISLTFLMRGWRTVRAGVVEFVLALFVAWSFISALFATNHWIALRSFGLTLSAFVLFLAARRVAAERLQWRVLPALALAATLAAAIGALQAYGVDLDWLATERAPGGTFGNRNFLAHFVTLAIPLVTVVLLHARRTSTAIAWTLALGVCMDAIVLTRSRAAWLGLAAALAVLAVTALIGRRTLAGALPRTRVKLLGAALALGLLTAVTLPNRLDWRSDSPYAQTLTRLTDYRSGSGRGRVIQYRNSLELVAMDPVFGTGPGNWFVKYPLVTTPPDPSFNAADPIPTNPWPSSDWIALIAERGLIGLLIVVLAGGAILLICLRRLRGDDSALALQTAAVLGILAVSVITGLFDAVLLNAAPAFLVAATLGLLLPQTQAVLERTFEPRAQRVATASIALIAVSVTAYSLVQFLAIRTTGDSQTRATIARAVRIDPSSYRLQLQLARRGNCQSRIPHARAAAQLLPHHSAPRAALAACGVRDRSRSTPR